VSGLTATAITKFGAAALAANDLSTTAIADVVYDGTQWELQNPQTTAAAGTVSSVTGTAPIVVATGTTTPAISLGTVPVANGGTGATTLTGYLSGNGTGAVTATSIIPGTAVSGNIAGSAANVTGTVAVANGGTGNTSGNAVNVTGIVATANGGTGTGTSIVPHIFFGNNGASAGLPGFGPIGASDISPNSYAAGGGTAQAQTVTLSPAVTALTPGLEVKFKPLTSNTTFQPTLRVNGLTPAYVTKYGPNFLAPFDLNSAEIADVIYDGTQWELQNPWTATGFGSVTSVTGTAPITVATGTTTPSISLGTVPVANGGTGATTLTGYLSGNGTGAVTASATIPGTSITGNIAGSAANVTGTVTVANGGTGATTFPSGSYLAGNGTSQLSSSTTIPGTSITGNIAGSSANVTGVAAAANGGTGTGSNISAHTFFGNNSSILNLGSFGLIGASDISPNSYAAAGGTAQAQTVTLTPAATALATGLEIEFKPVAANTGGAPTLSVNGLTATAITKFGATALAANDLTTIAIADVVYDGSQWELQNPQTTIPASIISGILPVADGGTGNTGPPSTGYVAIGGNPFLYTGSLFWDNTNNRLGIGTSGPQFGLDVETAILWNGGGQTGVLNYTGTYIENAQTYDVAIYTPGTVLATALVGYSDARSKNIIARSNTFSDLDILKKLKLTDYRYIDVVGKGATPRKGVIAQELEQLYPNAVKKVTDFIPNVYALADHFDYDEASRELTITVPKAHGFIEDDTVRIVVRDGDAEKRIEKKVTKIIDEHTFVLADADKAEGKVFVFGKIVNDFRVVDYDQLFDLNIGATQQLAIDNDNLAKENAAIKSENEAIKARLAALEQAVQTLQDHKDDLQTHN
jgi:hypothetical protein